MTDSGANDFYTAPASTKQCRFYVWLLVAMLVYLGATAAVRPFPCSIRCFGILALRMWGNSEAQW